MASGEQIKALLKSYIEGNDSQFFSVAIQVAAHEAKLGHGKLAQELRAMIDKAKTSRPATNRQTKSIPITQPRGELSNLLFVSYPKLRLSDIILSCRVFEGLERLIKEQRQINKIRSFGLSPRKKLLLVGPPGTGKTMSASVIAGELNLPLFEVRLDSLITKYMGETAAKLRLIFDSIKQVRGVYLFDEFDSIGSQRRLPNDVGEIRRVLNSFLQLIEQDDSDNILLAATNYPELLDYALFRRFDDVLQFDLPQPKEIIKALKSKLATIKNAHINWKEVGDVAFGLSYADIIRAAEETIKDAIINDRDDITSADLIKNLSDRKAILNK